MDKNDNKNPLSLNDPFGWRSLGFFTAEEYLVYVFKKTEKITAALYLVSGLLKDDEPLKWELRDRGIDLLSSSFSASNSVPGDKNIVIQSLFTAALETLSLLNVARVSNLVSEMNHQILVREIDSIVSMLRDRLAQNAENAGYILSESFFKTPDLFSTGFRNSFGVSDRSFHGQNSQSTKPSVDSLHMEKKVSVEDKKKQRQDAIINLLRGHPNLTIKDFSNVIKDCSEKTIQRELLELVAQGKVKKAGERRWSKYSLVQN